MDLTMDECNFIVNLIKEDLNKYEYTIKERKGHDDLLEKFASYTNQENKPKTI